MTQLRVDTKDDVGLRLRSEPTDKKKNVILTIPEGHLVEKLQEVDDLWWRVRVNLGGMQVEGFAAARFLFPAQDSAPQDLVFGISPVHLKENRPEVIRNTPNLRAFPLGEPGMPHRTAQDRPSKIQQIRQIIDFLDVEKSARYSPTTNATFCNIYAYDYCYLAGAYLPRVWWMQSAIIRLAGGEAVTPLFESTVTELNANGLVKWLEEFGMSFGWQRSQDLDELQSAANRGEVCVIAARRVDLNKSGHIVAVVPEEGEASAKRVSDHVVLPLQSQAGVKNRKLSTGTSAWWQDTARFRSFVFFRHS